MKTSSFLLLCILVACSVWAVHGRNVKVSIDDEDQVEISVETRAFPGICWGCKWALNKVKKMVGNNTDVEKLKAKLHIVCNYIGYLKSICRKFVNKHFGELIEELTTTDDVKTICVNTGACKADELEEMLFYPDYKGSKNEIDPFFPE